MIKRLVLVLVLASLGFSGFAQSVQPFKFEDGSIHRFKVVDKAVIYMVMKFSSRGSKLNLELSFEFMSGKEHVGGFPGDGSMLPLSNDFMRDMEFGGPPASLDEVEMIARGSAFKCKRTGNMIIEQVGEGVRTSATELLIYHKYYFVVD
jgi:hypothetical protein